MSQPTPSSEPSADLPRFEYLGAGYMRYTFLDPQGNEKSAVMHRKLMAKIAALCRDGEGTIDMWNEKDGSLSVKLNF